MYKTVLVNKEHKVKEAFLRRINLVEVVNFEQKKLLIEENTQQAYQELSDFLLPKGITIGIDSAYRSVEDQQKLYDEFVITYGKDYADSIVAQPGSSEHHTGLALDLSIKIADNWKQENNELLEQETVLREIHQYLHKFGFILRYPKEKEKITGYPYEPWHIRYVGKVISKIIFDNNWTLEEYLQEFSGIIAVNKHKGVTSFDIVNDICHIFGIKKVGHTGTLEIGRAHV